MKRSSPQIKNKALRSISPFNYTFTLLCCGGATSARSSGAVLRWKLAGRTLLLMVCMLLQLAVLDGC